ncbi:MAG: hypothetical protein ACXVZV_07655, partial [Terriglobales bacterium]
MRDQKNLQLCFHQEAGSMAGMRLPFLTSPFAANHNERFCLFVSSQQEAICAFGCRTEVISNACRRPAPVSELDPLQQTKGQ